MPDHARRESGPGAGEAGRGDNDAEPKKSSLADPGGDLDGAGHLRSRLGHSLAKIYPDLETAALVARAEGALREYRSRRPAVKLDDDRADRWSEDDVMLITYGDSVRRPGEAPLRTLADFLAGTLEGTVSGVHILPFFPYSSDDGFSVIDYRSVDPELGDWGEIREIASRSTLMVDLVINHVSAKSEWFDQFVRGEHPGTDYFITLDPETDTSSVVRPRPHPLLAPVETSGGVRHVWATFSHDQIDLDFSNPDVLFEMVDVLLFYLAHGARWVRLDAVGFLWKRIGTSCMHLPETHEAVRLLRTIAEAAEPRVVLITETNVPNAENLSYFGNCNEAHAIYNFSLPPLLLDALVQGRSDYLKAWMMSMPPAPFGCAYFNFTASHDGIGLRPAEGLLSAGDIEVLTRTMERFGGHLSMRALADGSLRPYEINISLFDALQGTVAGPDSHQEARFLCAQTIMLGLEGIPAIYLHSLLATANDHRGVERTGRFRSINRHRWDGDLLAERLADPESAQSRILDKLGQLVRLRRGQRAFHPNATQYTLQLGDRLFAFWRQSLRREQSIFAVHNVTDTTQVLLLSSLNMVSLDAWFDLISGQEIRDLHGEIELAPYQCLWLTNGRPSSGGVGGDGLE